ncbi:DUF4870 domain-containing protein [Oceanihabitans sediminis]|uniref:DUF4870 domain-containing protein n=1 Tax=Oceanihabitans sediminis TaxID=1812012 RepID=A0A368P3A9_9FLAO|nr:DUF4870 domain-containing protein [Oceanihabitans sediminis]MDX1277402.1 DUF4870 domain-containing protein [Oceanihabitans sediminis]MDX1774199.1 DUF4870 domain-containing protein [Oceanihabitans sediminis]RBP30792.1 hypothetical protein DFR65_10449 [Oceanihabitans sediminis]RCU56760.1 DUF4870 domain-containing protein [Oceanihabitans sediminis]
MISNNQKNIATFIHLSTFSRFVIPFGNIIGPLLLWIINKDKSEFIDNHGKQALNFQLSIILYTFLFGLLCIPLIAFNVLSYIDIVNIEAFNSLNINLEAPSPILFFIILMVFLAAIAFIIELIFIINASLTANKGEAYKYPFTIHFLK